MKKLNFIPIVVMAVAAIVNSVAMATLIPPTVEITHKGSIYQAEVISGGIGNYSAGDKFLTICIEINEWKPIGEVEVDISEIATRNGGDFNKGYNAVDDGDPLGPKQPGSIPNFWLGPSMVTNKERFKKLFAMPNRNMAAQVVMRR